MAPQDDFKFGFAYDDLFVYARHLAGHLNVPFQNDEIIYPAAIATGYSRFFTINRFLSYQVVHYVANRRILLSRSSSLQSHIAVTFRNFSFKKSDRLVNGFPEIVIEQNNLGSIQCRSTQQPETMVIEPGMEVKSIVVLMKEGWLEHILHDSMSKEKFLQYLVNQNANLNLRKEFLSPRQNKLFARIFSGNNCFLMQNLFYDSRVLNLMESFLKEVLTKEDTDSPYLFASYEDIHALQKAEQYINDNLMNPFPGVEVLSRISCMCRTKFINLFQKVYGLSSFEYSQKKRLTIAFQYLKSGKYSVSDTAQVIGYTGVNNFAAAFKKEFGLLPSELLGEVKEFVSP
jgi:AraC-like DNA-binding protein